MYFGLLLVLLSTCCICHDTDALLDTKLSNRILQNGKLIFTNVLYRHGDRTPFPLCPNDPLNNLRYWPKEWTQLTNLGAQQQYKLGQWLRNRYDTLLSRTYKPSQIYVRSTDTDRTISSALANLAGLYAPMQTEMWHPDLRWQPIPVHTVPVDDDYLMGTANCSKFRKLYLENLETVGINEVLNPLFGYFTQECGFPIATFEKFMYMYDGFKIEEDMNKSVPAFARPFYGNELLENVFSFGFVSYSATPELARFSGGPLIKQMLTNMRNKVDGKLEPDRSMWMYSGHDTTIASVLSSLNLYDLSQPPYHRPGYASVFLMELHLDEQKNPYVSVQYRNDTNSKPQLLTIPRCGTVCPLDMMFSLYKNVLPDDIVAECE